MKLNRIALFPLLLCLLLAGACNKDKGGRQTEVISGVYLRTVDAAPAGQEGAPDIHTEDLHCTLLCYPNPSIEVLNLHISNTNPATTVRILMMPALFESAPASALIENRWIVGSVSLDQSFPLPQTTANGHKQVSLDVSKLPRGFYRLYAETADGARCWDNIWLTK
ncbi:hypothetical protein [Taibaiella chishuiensis]|uniref:Secreted protein (Por secretion system target) n=1 Tax=Taibaiella chishuiensis TaxID=1434707 RepID=A0A2P8DCP2_9BACT|nr:hypothetical protein [Taibaiella chishuiensis]PSK94986.1 hypothetical protein B0I18_1011150 [Taibaiella chishuiensis]